MSLPFKMHGTDTVREKILISAFAASPVKGSEHAVGWEWVCTLARHYDVWVITRSCEEKEIVDYLEQHKSAEICLHFMFVGWEERASYTSLLHHLDYRRRYIKWQKDCYALALKLHAEQNFALAYHLNGTGFREPGFLWKLNIPFVWGPIGGLQFFPLRMLASVPLRAGAFFCLRNLTTWWMMHVAHRPRAAARAAVEMIAATRGTAACIDRLWQRKATILSEVTAPGHSASQPHARSAHQPLQLVWCGRIDANKALTILLTALGQLRHADFDWELNVLGDGPLKTACEQQAATLGIADRCHFQGRLTREQALEEMRRGHVFVHTCLYELTGTATVEALHAGLPLLCLDHLAISDTVRQHACGIPISSKNSTAAAQGFAEAIECLASDEARRYAMANAALIAAESFAAKKKEGILLEVLRRAVAANSSRETGNDK